MNDRDRETRDRYARMLASGHAFVQSIAMENVCGDCGGHRDYHQEVSQRPVEDDKAVEPVVLHRPRPSSPVPCWSVVGSGFAADNVRAYQLQGRF